MKKVVLITCFFTVISISVFSQSGIFNKIYKIPTNYYSVNGTPNFISSQSNCYYYAIGNGMFSGCAQQGLYKIDSSGNVLWFNNCSVIVDTLPDGIEFSSPPYYLGAGRVLSLDFDADSNIIICGYSALGDDIGIMYNFVQKLDKDDGAVIWFTLSVMNFMYQKVIVAPIRS